MQMLAHRSKGVARKEIGASKFDSRWGSSFKRFMRFQGEDAIPDEPIFYILKFKGFVVDIDDSGFRALLLFLWIIG